jgi:predicted MFS family arabinose efflux permease
VITGGAVGERFGWQAGFWAVGLPGLALAALFFFLRDPPTAERSRGPIARPPDALEGVAELFRSRSILVAFAATGVLVFVSGTMMAWLPTFFNRVYGLPPAAASVRAAGAILAAGVGASFCGFVIDRFARRHRCALFLGSAGIAVAVALLLGAAFQLGPGRLQYALILVGSLGLAGTQGPMAAAIASLVHPGRRATALATLAVVQNVVGLAAGGLITGLLSDRMGIARALAVVPLIALLAAAIYAAGARSYERELRAAPADEAAAP